MCSRTCRLRRDVTIFINIKKRLMIFGVISFKKDSFDALFLIHQKTTYLLKVISQEWFYRLSTRGPRLKTHLFRVHLDSAQPPRPSHPP
jgi:hypothetical protein